MATYRKCVKPGDGTNRAFDIGATRQKTRHLRRGERRVCEVHQTRYGVHSHRQEIHVPKPSPALKVFPLFHGTGGSLHLDTQICNAVDDDVVLLREPGPPLARAKSGRRNESDARLEEVNPNGIEASISQYRATLMRSSLLV